MIGLKYKFSHYTLTNTAANGVRILALFALSLLSFLVSAQTTISHFNFDTDTETNWTYNTGDCSWEVGVPNGGQGFSTVRGQRGFVGNVDPTVDNTSDNTINFVAGQGLEFSDRKEGVSGHFNSSNEWIQSPVFNCADYINVTLEYYRWANFEPGYDYGFIEVSSDNVNWNTVYAPTILQDTEWVKHVIDISKYADRSANVYVRWRSESDGSIFYSGWNIDDVTISGTYNTNDNTSSITAGAVSVPGSISSLVDIYNEKVVVGEFTINDAGSGDGLSTIIDTFNILPGNYNTISNWNDVIANLYIENINTGEIKSAVVKSNLIFMSNSAFFTVADGSSETYQVSMYLGVDLPDDTDNKQFDFVVDYGNMVEDVNGSTLSSGELSTGNSKLVVDIEATQLSFMVEPQQLVSANRDLLPYVKVAATDANGNIDTDYSGSISITNTGGLLMSGNAENTVGGMATFNDCRFTETGGPVKLQTSHSGSNSISNVTSDVSVTIESSLDNAVFFDNFDNSGITGWTHGANYGSDAWEIGVPNGGQGYSDVNRRYIGNSDPTTDNSSDNTINNVYGQGLSSRSRTEGVAAHYNASEDWLMTPAIDLSSYYNTQLSFSRWANFEPYYDSAFVEISNDGSNWIDLGHPLFPADIDWIDVSFDISAIADRQSTVYIRWRMVSDQSVFYAGWNIDDVQIAGIFSPIFDWTGTVSDEWHNAANWSSGVIPDKLSNVIIPSGTPFKPVITRNSECNEIIIKKNTALLIENSGSLTVYGDMKIETDVLNYGAVIDKGNLTVLGNGVVSRYINEKQWNYVSIPMTTVNSSVFGDDVHYYDEILASDDWNNGWVLAENTALQVGTGYDVYHFKNNIVNLEGTFNTGNVGIPISNTNGAEVSEHEGWNFIGNPYPSAIDWDASSGWTKTNVNNAIYIWDEDLQNFVAYVSGVGVNGGSRYIPPMQGFFVKASSPGSGYIGMSNDIRITNTDSKFKSTNAESATLRINLSNAWYSDETIIRYKDDAQLNFDNGYDALKKFSTNTSVSQIFTKTGKEELLMVNTLPSTTEYSEIQLYVNINNRGEYILDFEGAWNFDATKTVYLEDVLLDTLIDLLSVQQYSFYSERAQELERFKVHIGMPLKLKSSVKHVSEFGLRDGAIDVTIYGGVQPLSTIVWSNGSESEDLNSVGAGSYIITVTDAFNNSLTDTILVEQGEYISPITSTEELELSNGIKVFEANKQIVISILNNLPADEVTVYGIEGNVLYYSHEPFSNQFVLPLTLQTGVYLVRIKQDQNYNVSKIAIR